MHPNRSRRQTGAASKHPDRGNDLTGLALWMAATLAGMVTAILLARGPFFESLLARLGGPKASAAKPSRRQGLPMLASAIIGSSKSAIESVLGPPRSAAVKGVAVVVYPKMVFWHADTWYYPLPRNGPMAMAINFNDDLATQVEFFTSPHLPE